MRMTLVILAGLIAGAAADTARADQYAWCAIMGGGRDGGATNCYFVTLAQCKAAVSGVGGFCMASPYYTGRPVVTPEQTQRKKKS